MTQNEPHDRLARVAARRRSAFVEAGLSLPFAPLMLRDATLLAPRWRHGAHCVSLYHRDVHVIGRAYACDEMVACHNGTSVPVRTTPGAVTVVPAGFAITYDIPHANDFSLVALPDSRLQTCAAELTGGRRIQLAERLAVDDPVTSAILDAIHHELVHSDRSSTLLLERAIDLLCLQLVQRHAAITVRPAARGLAPWQVKRVTSYMRDHLDDDIGLGELAALVGLSRFHFCTAFRLATGRTPHEWLTRQRIEHAQALLVDDPSLRITDIALAVGYATPSAFTASFRRLAGVTPSQFRRRATR